MWQKLCDKGTYGNVTTPAPSRRADPAQGSRAVGIATL